VGNWLTLAKVLFMITRSLSLAGICFFCLSRSAQAAIVTWMFSGTIGALGLGGNDPVPGISLGDTVTGTVTYNTSAPASDLGWATGYDLTASGGLVQFVVNGLTFSTSVNSDVSAQVLNDRAGYGDVVNISDANYIDDIYLELEIGDEVAPFDLLADESLPTFLDFSKAEELYPGTLSGNYGFIQTQGLTGATPIQTAHFSIDTFSMSVIPVPAAAWLFGSGLLGLVGMARRKKA